MKAMYRVPLVLLTTAAAVSLGVVGVQASTECVRFIQNKVRRNHKVSAATAARWAAWNKAHPNWHPKPTPKETLAQIDFACKVPLDEKTPPMDALPPVELGKFGIPIDMSTPPEPTTPVEIASSVPPADLFPSHPGNDVVSPPIYAPEFPVLFGPIPVFAGQPPVLSAQPPSTPLSTPTPEPAGWVLMATAALATGGIVMRRNQAASL